MGMYVQVYAFDIGVCIWLDCGVQEYMWCVWCIGTYIYSVYVDVPYIHMYVKVFTNAYKYIYNILYISVSLLVPKVFKLLFRAFPIYWVFIN